jgi:hypothetical protein
METIIGFALLLLIVVVCLIAVSIQEQKLADPSNTEVVYLDQIAAVALLKDPGRFRMRTYRQSGNLQKDDVIFDSAVSAIKAGVTSFRRSKIPYAVIQTNTEDAFVFRRPFHDNRGRNEGKKMSSIEIVRI